VAGVALVGLARQNETPEVAIGSAQVMLSFCRLSSIAVRLPIQTSSANTAPVASIFMPETIDAGIVLADHLQGRIIAHLAGEDLAGADARRRVTANER